MYQCDISQKMSVQLHPSYHANYTPDIDLMEEKRNQNFFDVTLEGEFPFKVRKPGL